MSSFVSLGIVLLSSLIIATLQLAPSTLLLLYRSSLGKVGNLKEAKNLKKAIKKRTKSLVSSYISGVALIIFLILSAVCFLISVLSTSGVLSSLALLVLVGILGLFSFSVLFFYYRKSGTTELWIPRKVAKFINSRAEKTSDNSEAFSLGILATLSEIIFSIIPIILSADSILRLDEIFQVFAIALFTIISILPLLIIRFIIRNGKTIVDIQRWRLKNKNFFRIIIGLEFFTMAMFTLAFLVMKEGG